MAVDLETAVFIYTRQAIAVLCLGWCIFVAFVQTVGIVQIFRHFSSRPRPAVSPSLPLSEVPHVTIIRPVSGLEPELDACLSSAFRQNYPPSRLSIRLCVEAESDTAYPLLRRLVDSKFASLGLDAQILVQSHDPVLHGPDGDVDSLGPNRKVRNVSRAYREAKSDIVWMLDSNVWVGRNTLGRMVDGLMGLGQNGETETRYKLMHQLPLVVDAAHHTWPSMGSLGTLPSLWRQGGGRLDEMFFATTHAKFYTSINTIQTAPCILGKSNMFRRSDLAAATEPKRDPGTANGKMTVRRPNSIDYFSSYICEDHLIGVRLWELEKPGYDRHGMLLGDLVFQPMKYMAVTDYIARRVRWLRARKWTVLLATWIEPGIECFLYSAYLSFAMTTLPLCSSFLGIAQTWSAMAALWCATVVVWAAIDRQVFMLLHAGWSVDVDEHTPHFASGRMGRGRGVWEWLVFWLGREMLALPIWCWAFCRPTVVKWRGKTYRVARDMSAVELVR